jgi:hypothetical protein
MRTGIPSIIAIGVKLCQLIATFTPVILAITDNDEDVENALNAANAACAALVAILRPHRSFGD